MFFLLSCGKRKVLLLLFCGLCCSWAIQVRDGVQRTCRSGCTRYELMVSNSYYNNNPPDGVCYVPSPCNHARPAKTQSPIQPTDRTKTGRRNPERLVERSGLHQFVSQGPGWEKWLYPNWALVPWVEGGCDGRVDFLGSR